MLLQGSMFSPESLSPEEVARRKEDMRIAEARRKVEEDRLAKEERIREQTRKAGEVVSKAIANDSVIDATIVTEQPETAPPIPTTFSPPVLKKEEDNGMSLEVQKAASNPPTTNLSSFDDAVLNRYACTRYQRHESDSLDANDVVSLASEALALATRAPTGFNVQPYKLLLVESPEAKEALAKYCIGRNRDRVLDSDCSVVFLADRQACSSWSNYKTLLLESSDRNKKKKWWSWLKLRALVALFSSGFPLPKLIGGPISFGMRFAMRICSWIFRHRLVVPTLSSPECWSQKNTMLVAATYLLGCSARGLDTTPMEGYLSWGVRQSLKIPRRYTIPLIVSTGRAYKPPKEADEKDEEDDAGMSHGRSPDLATPRYPIDSVVCQNFFS